MKIIKEKFDISNTELAEALKFINQQEEEFKKFNQRTKIISFQISVNNVNEYFMEIYLREKKVTKMNLRFFLKVKGLKLVKKILGKELNKREFTFQKLKIIPPLTKLHKKKQT